MKAEQKPSLDGASGLHHDAFISYSHQDREFVLRLRAALQERGKDVWLDESGIHPSERWEAALHRAIEGSDAFIFVISEYSAVSAECRSELDHAIRLNKRIIPVVASSIDREMLPSGLGAFQFVPPRGEFGTNVQVSSDLLVSAIDTDLDWVRDHTQWGLKAIEWDDHRRDASFLLAGSELEAAEQWLARQSGKRPEPTALHNEFVLVSRRHVVRRLRRTRAITAVALAIVSTLAVIALVLRNQAITQSHNAQSEQLAAEATNVSATNAPLAMLLSVAAYERAPTAEARTALIRAGRQPLDMLLTVSTSAVTAVAYSADGQDLATGDADGRITVWNTATWRHARLSSTNSAITALAFSPDQNYLVAGDDAGDLGVWDTQTGKAQISAGKGSNSIRCLAFSASGKFFGAGFSNGTILLSNLATGHHATLREGYQIAQPVASIAFSPDGQTLAAGNNDGGIQLWDTATGRLSKTLVTQTESTAVTSLAFSPDGKTLAVGGYSDLIRLRSISAVTETASLAEDSPVESVAFSRAGNTLAAGTTDGTIGLWNVKSRTQTATFGEGSPVTTVAYSPDGKTLAVADASGHVGLWDTTLGSQASTFSDGDGSPVTNAAFSPDGKTLAAGDLAGSVMLWNTSSRRRLADLYEVMETYSTAFSPGGQTLAVGYLMGVDLWNITVRQHPVLESARPPTLAEGGGGSDSVAFNLDGTVLAVGDYRGGVGLWDVANRRRLAAMNVGSSVNSVAFSPNGKILAVGDANGDITLWWVTSHNRIATLNEGSTVNSVAFSPDGQTLAAGDRAGHISLWRVTSHQRNAILPDGSAVGAVSFSPDGRTLASGDALGDVNTWDLASQQRLATLAKTSTSISSLAFSRDGQEVAAGGYNGTVTLLMQRRSNLSQGFLIQLICGEVQENITRTQWADNAPGVPYQKSCPAYP